MTDIWPADYRLIVLEGCDGAGKSTLAGRLAAEHGFAIFHSSRTPDHLDLAARYRDLLATPGRMVLDRCFLSELVYGRLYRGRSRLTWSQALRLAEAVIARDGVFVHMTASPAVIHARLTRRDDRTMDIADISLLVSAYERLFGALAAYVAVMRVDTSAERPPLAG